MVPEVSPQLLSSTRAAYRRCGRPKNSGERLQVKIRKEAKVNELEIYRVGRIRASVQGKMSVG